MANSEIHDGHQNGCPPKLHMVKNGISKWSDNVNKMAATMATEMANTTSKAPNITHPDCQSSRTRKFLLLHPKQSSNAGNKYSNVHKSQKSVFLTNLNKNTHRYSFCRSFWSNLLKT